MALTPGKIHLGAARIFVGVTPAVTGTPPTYTTHTDGVPSSGTEVGLTQGDTEFNFVSETKLSEAEQALGYVQVFTIAERAELIFTCLEQTYTTLKLGFQNVGTETIAGGDAFWFGGGTSVNRTQQCVMATSRQVTAPTKFIIVQLYKVDNIEGYKIPFSRTKESMYRCRLVGLFDTSRAVGDQLGYYRLEK
jgi:hypothetical protein